MKKLHLPNLFCWSQFNEERNIDFHTYLWMRPSGNVVIDPLAISEYDKKHLQSLGKVTHIIITNSDHTRDVLNFAKETGAEVWGPEGEKATFPIKCSQWLMEGMEPLPGLKVYTLNGSKTPGELALLIEKRTLITGDLIRAHEGGRLCLIPDAKLKDKGAAMESVRRIAGIGTIEAVLPGDGWPIFYDGKRILEELIRTFKTETAPA